MTLRCLGQIARCQRATLCGLLFLQIFFSPWLYAQEISDEEDQKLVIGRADTSSPRATLKSFLEACDDIYNLVKREQYLDPNIPAHRAVAMRIVDCLDTSQLPEYSRLERAAEAAVCLKEILDRVEIPLEQDVPDAAAIESSNDDGKKYRWRVLGTRIAIARVDQGPQRHEYLFTPGTVERAFSYYQDMRHLPYRQHGPNVTPGFYRWYISAPRSSLVASILDHFPDWVRNQKFGITIWKLPPLILSLLLAVLLLVGIYKLQSRFAVRSRQKGLVLYCLSILFPLAAILVPIGLKIFIADYLALRGKPFYYVSFGADLVVLSAFVVVVFGVSNRVAEIIISSPRIHPRGLDAQLIRILAKLASLAGVAILFIEGGTYLGIPVTTLLASAGVGGLAVALAAQDTLKALFGTLTLMADKPFRIGDRIIFQKYDGVVEDIGLRSTQLRLLSGNQATVPNDELARSDIENVSRRPHIRRVANIKIPLDTRTELVEEAVQIVRKALDNHEGMQPAFPPRVFFNEVNDDSFNIRMMYWYHPADYWKFLAFSQRLNLQIGQAFEALGISFLLPTRITYSSANGEGQGLSGPTAQG